MLKTSKFIAHLACYMNVALAYIHQGFELGHDESAALHISGGSGYGLLAKHYTIIFLLLFIFFIGKTIKKTSLSHIICFSSLVLAIFQYRIIYLQKSLFFENTDTFTKLMRETMPFDLISLSLILFLLIYQIVTVFQYYFEWKRNDTKVE